jgi:hypothetical protein
MFPPSYETTLSKIKTKKILKLLEKPITEKKKKRTKTKTKQKKGVANFFFKKIVLK